VAEPVENPKLVHNESDVDVRAIVGFGIALLVVGAVVHLLLWLLFAYFSAEASRIPREFPLAAAEQQQLPPEPRLQANPREDLREFRQREDAILNSYGWVDKGAGIARIPIDEAIRITVQKGLPSQ
jgi:hypothetical protein